MAINTQLNTASTPIGILSGGTGVSTMTTAYAPVCAGTTATGTLQVASTGLGTSGFVLTSNGSAALPSFQSFPVPITTASITLSTTDIRNMYATPVQILAAQGANTMIVVYHTIFEYVFNTSAFSAGDGNGPVLQYSNTNHAGGGIVAISGINITASTASTVSYRTPYNGNGSLASTAGNPSTVMINKGLFATNPTAAYTGGDSSVIVTVYYSVLTTTL